MKHMKKKPNSQDECGVGERGGIIVCGLLPPSADSFHRPRTPSTARGLLPPPAGGPPPSKREVLGFRRSKPAALPSIGYRGFAVAPITLRAPADILPTFDFPVPIPPSSREGDRPVGGGRSKQAVEGVRFPQAPEGVRNPAGRDFSLGGVSFMPLGISPADEHRRPRRTASLRWRSRPARRRRLHR